jgi:DNA-binding MarR family transcriptional regulator
MPATASPPARPTAASRAAPPSPPPFFDPATFHPELGVLWMLRRAQLAIGQLVGEAMQLGGSTLPQWVPLYKIHRGEADTVAELARRCTIDAGAMTRLLDRLEARGLCRRVRSETDRRVVHIALTPEGVAAAEQMPRVLCGVYNEVLQDFSPDEWDQLRTLLARATDRAEALLATSDTNATSGAKGQP